MGVYEGWVWIKVILLYNADYSSERLINLNPMTNYEQVRVFGPDTTHLNPAGFDTLVEITAFIKSKHYMCKHIFWQ